MDGKEVMTLDYRLAQLGISTLTLVGSGAAYLLLARKPTPPCVPTQAHKYGSHGSSQWASAKEIMQAFPDAGAGAILGRIPAGKGWRSVIFPWDRSGGNRFILVIGPPGSGKTFCYSMPNLLHAATVDRQRSIVITDPKGQMHRDTAALMQSSGFTVCTLNLIDFDASCRYNPLDYVESAEDAQRLAATIVTNTDGPHGGGEAFWRHSEEALIACLIWFVKATRPPEERHLGNVLHLAGVFGADKALMDRTFGQYALEDPIRRLYAPVAGLEDKTRAGVFAGVTASRLKIWASDRITRLTSASDFRIEDLGQGPVALYLIIPDHDSTYRVLSSLFFDQVFQQLIALADRKDGKLPFECRLLLEEMANVGRIPDLEKRLATVRSRGILVEMILQTLGQLKSLYGDAWSTIVGCADTMLVLAANDLETAQYVSMRLGTTTIRTSSQSLTRTERGGSESQSQHYTGRALMTPEEVMGQGVTGLASEELLLIRRGLQARIHKNPVNEMPDFGRLVPSGRAGKPSSPPGKIKLTKPESLVNLQAKPAEGNAAEPSANPTWDGMQGGQR